MSQWHSPAESGADDLGFGIWNKDDLLASPQVPAELRVSARERLEHRRKNERWGDKRAAVIKVLKQHPEMRPVDIARRVGCDKSYVHTVRHTIEKGERHGEAQGRRRARGQSESRNDASPGQAPPEAAA